METVRRFQDFAGPAVWVMMLILAIYLTGKAGSLSLSVDMPADELAETAKSATGMTVTPGSFAAIAAIACDLGDLLRGVVPELLRLLPVHQGQGDTAQGQLWGLPVNLIVFSLVAALTTAAANKVYGAGAAGTGRDRRRSSTASFLVLLAAITFAVATLGINVVANFVSPAFDFSNVAPKHINFRRGGLIAALIALVLYPWHPWDNAPSFVTAIGSMMGPLFGVIIVDYYLIRRAAAERAGRSTGRTASSGSRAAGTSEPSSAMPVGAIFSSILPVYGPAGYAATLGPYTWFIGVIVAGALYYVITGRRSPILATTPDSQPAKV